MFSSVKDKLSPAQVARIKYVATVLQIVPNAFYDMYRYLSYSASNSYWDDEDKLRSMLIKDYHRLEKGMSLSKPKMGFGYRVASRLAWNLKLFRDGFQPDETFSVALNVMDSYLAYSTSTGYDFRDLSESVKCLRESMDHLADIEKLSDKGGVRTIYRRRLDEKSSSEYFDFVSSRYSIRQFSPEHSPTVQDIEVAVKAAAQTPSVCNRQPWRLHLVAQSALSQELLKLQNGNAGFGDQAAFIGVVTCDLSSFEGAGERNQVYIDGGMFAVSIAYALHASGIGTCFLNWSVTANADRKIRELIEIPLSHAVITLVAIGGIPVELKVAQSPRRNHKELMIKVE